MNSLQSRQIILDIQNCGFAYKKDNNAYNLPGRNLVRNSDHCHDGTPGGQVHARGHQHDVATSPLPRQNYQKL